MVDRRANDRLRSLVREARWSGDALARAVNAIGSEAGLSLNYGRASVTHWMSGRQPRPPAPVIVAEALSRRLGRLVTAVDVGFAAGVAAAVDPAVVDPVAEMIDLVRVADGGVLRPCVYRVAALSVPDWGQLVALAGEIPPESGRRAAAAPARIGRAEADTAESMLRLFSTADASLGGHATRVALADYLATTIGPWLRVPGGSELLVTAARLTYLCGFMCFDDELHGAAQRYYGAALRLAGWAGSRAQYAITLRALSVQARRLGHRTQALRLAEAAVDAGGDSAFLTGQLAVACADAGDRRAALTHLRSAGRAIGSTSPVGAYHQASLAYQRAAALQSLGERGSAIAALERAVRDRPAAERRSHAITLAELAELQLGQGHLDRAVATWHRFLDGYPSVRSGRVRTSLGNLRARVRPHLQHPGARALWERATVLR